MEKVSRWLEDVYKKMWNEFNGEEFRDDDVTKLLNLSEEATRRAISLLERSGYIMKRETPFDMREKLYRVIPPTVLEEIKELQKEKIGGKSLDSIVDSLWKLIKEKIKEISGFEAELDGFSEIVERVAEGKEKRDKLKIIDKQKIKKLDKSLQRDVEELLKLFDGSGNYYRSITNVLLEYKKMMRWIEEGKFSVSLPEYALFDGVPLLKRKEIKNTKLCPICREYEQKQGAQALICGNPKTDSVFHLYRGGSRALINLCGWCFLAGYVDLPISTIRKEGQSVGKEKEYLYISSPISNVTMQKLLDFISGRKEDIEVETDLNEDFLSFIGEGWDSLSVLGMSKERLSNLKGFALPSINDFISLAGARFPFESLIAMKGAKVSGSVKKALVSATFYDLYKVTRGSLHYGRLGEGMFSIFGEEIELDEMRRSNMIYNICSRYARNRFDLNIGLFMLFFGEPRKAANLIFRKMDRSGYSLGLDKTLEVINMVEEISEKDWVFDLGLEITGTLVDLGLIPKAGGFWKSRTDTFSGVELVKWLQSFKMVRDDNSARNWATRVIHGIKRERGSGPNQEEVKKIMDMTEKVIQKCSEKKMKLSEFSRKIADMDLYLVFYYNQKMKDAEGGEET
ncbi:MAG: hypothetical protein ACXQS7_05705 [Candidatus Syntropharchaeia archaeon]